MFSKNNVLRLTFLTTQYFLNMCSDKLTIFFEKIYCVVQKFSHNTLFKKIVLWQKKEGEHCVPL